MRPLFLMLLMIISTLVFAVEESVSSKIKVVYAYPEYGGGDVVFQLAIPSQTCKGYWLNKDAPGQQVTLSMLIAAYHAKIDVKVLGHPEESNKWQGSTEHFCKLYAVIYGL